LQGPVNYDGHNLLKGRKGDDANLARVKNMGQYEDDREFIKEAQELIANANYPEDLDRYFDLLRKRGFELGAHGLSHDGRLFRSLRDFRALAPKLEAIAREHGLRGFRSPSTLRRHEWIQELDFDFDSSPRSRSG